MLSNAQGTTRLNSKLAVQISKNLSNKNYINKIHNPRYAQLSKILVRTKTAVVETRIDWIEYFIAHSFISKFITIPSLFFNQNTYI